MTNEELIQTKINSAREAAAAFLTVLELEDYPAWAKRFSDIQSALESGDTKGALHLFNQIRYGGMGSLSDIFASDEKRFNTAWGNCSKTIGELRLLFKYGISD